MISVKDHLVTIKLDLHEDSFCLVAEFVLKWSTINAVLLSFNKFVSVSSIDFCKPWCENSHRMKCKLVRSGWPM